MKILKTVVVVLIILLIGGLLLKYFTNNSTDNRSEDTEQASLIKALWNRFLFNREDGGRQGDNRPDTKSASGTYEGTLQHDGLTRNYTVHLPVGYNTDTSYPVVFVLHGGGGFSDNFLEQIGIINKADEAGFILVAPEGVNGNWNDGRGFTARAETTDTVSQVDDVGFIAALIEELQANYAVDEDRIYSTGISNGSQMTQRLACDRPDLFAAVGPISGPMVNEMADSCPNPSPIPVVGIQGSDDPFFPIYDDDGLPELSPLLARQGIEPNPLSIEQITHFWTTANGCSTAPSVSNWPDTANDGTTVEVYRYTNCSSGADVTYYIIYGGGHIWPGMTNTNDSLATRIVGKASQNISANDVIWDFFSTHSK